MKRILILLLCVLALLTACNFGRNKDTSSDTGKPTSTTATGETTTSATETTTTSATEEEPTDGGTTTTTAGGGSNTGGYRYLSGSHYEEKTGEHNPDLNSPKNLVNSQSGAYDAQALQMRKDILAAKDELKITGKTYYISNSGDDWNDGESPDSAWQTVDALSINSYKINSGDAILFERGGVYRLSSTINITKSGITFGAYGTGDKPRIYGSTFNYAQGNRWEPSNKKNIWKMKFTDTDAGIMVFNHGEAAGNKTFGLMAMTRNLDFYHNVSEGMLYLYCDKGRPDEVFYDIEIGANRRIFAGWGGRSDITIDNLCLKYTGSHAIDFYGQNSNIRVTNCEIGWIGGSIQTGFTQYGNGIQFYASASNVWVENNWIYQIYDAALTYQHTAISESSWAAGGGQWDNIHFSKNLLEYANWAVEITNSARTGTTFGVGHMYDIHINDNLMRFSGYEWSNTQRPRRDTTSFLTGWRRYYDIKNFYFTNNILDCPNNQFVFWETGGVKQEGLTISGNTYIMKPNSTGKAMHFGVGEGLNVLARNQQELEKAIAYFDPAPKLVRWMD